MFGGTGTEAATQLRALVDRLAPLRAADRAGLESQWCRGASPSADELEGCYRGKLLWMAGVPDSLRPLTSLAWGGLWKGKAFQRPRHPGGDGRGYNLQLSWSLPVPGLPFVTRLEASRIDGQQVLTVDYGTGRGGLWMSVRDELRAVGAGLYLGAMLVDLRGEGRVLSYFSLQR